VRLVLTVCKQNDMYLVDVTLIYPLTTRSGRFYRQSGGFLEDR